MKLFLARIVMVGVLVLAQSLSFACPCMLDERKQVLEEEILKVGELYSAEPNEVHLAKLTALNEELESIVSQMKHD